MVKRPDLPRDNKEGSGNQHENRAGVDWVCGAPIAEAPYRRHQKLAGCDRPHRPHRPFCMAKVNSANGIAAQGLRTVGGSADGLRGTNGLTVRTKRLKIKDKNDADGADASSATFRPRKHEHAGLEGAAMSAVKALKAACAVSIRLRIDGDALTLEAATAPPPTLLDLLSDHSAAVVAPG